MLALLVLSAWSDKLEESPPQDTITDPATDTDTAVIADEDGDGYGADEDCNDSNPSTHPGAEEECDGVDNDCNGEVDDGVMTTYYADADDDGHGDGAETIESCFAPAGYVATDSDCDDTDDDISPDADEHCADGADNDCDGLLDCEDGDCTTNTACTEDCANGVDDDENGLIDCDDSACVLEAVCLNGGKPLVRIRGGTFRHRGVFDSKAGYGAGWPRNDYYAEVSSVSGTLRMLSTTGMRWSTATTATVCTWTLDAASWHAHKNTSSWFSGSVFLQDSHRSGFQISAACPVTTSGFLPERVFPIGRGEPALIQRPSWESTVGVCSTMGGGCVPRYGKAWYDGATLLYSNNINTSFREIGYYNTYWQRVYTGTTYTLKALSPQETFIAR